MVKRFLFGFLLFSQLLPGTGACLFAQELSFSHLTGADGLSNNTVYDLVEDKWGFIWIATRYGLNRYDGYAFKHYEPEFRPGDNQGQCIYSLYAAPSGDIWAGFRDGGIQVVDRQTERLTPFEAAPLAGVDWNNLTIRRFFEDSQGRIWLGTNGQGALVLDAEYHFLFRLGDDQAPERWLSSNFVVDFTEDPEGNVWIATGGTGINVYSSKTKKTRVFHEPGPGVADMASFNKSLVWDSAGFLWIGTEGNGLYRFEPVKQLFTHLPKQAGGLTSDLITDLLPDNNGKLLVATDGGGLQVLDTRSGHFTIYQYEAENDHSLNTNALYDIFKDRKGNTWIGTFNGGLNLLKPNRAMVQHLKPHHPPLLSGSRSVLALAADASGRIWAGTDGGGLVAFDLPTGGSAYFTTENSRVSGNVITSVHVRADGRLWLGTFAKGLSLFDPRSGVNNAFRLQLSNPQSLLSDIVWDLDEDTDKGLWLATLGGGLNYLPDGSQSFRRFVPEVNNDASISDWIVMDVLHARNGLIWVATETQGLCSLDPLTGHFTRYQQVPGDKNGIGSNHLRCLFEDADGGIWIGTEGGGLTWFQPDKGIFQRFTHAQGLPSNLVAAINQDLNGYIWVSTNEGLARIDPASGSIRPHVWDDGLHGNSFNPKATLRLDHGLLLFGGTNGISVIDPNYVFGQSAAPGVVLTDFKIFNQTVNHGVFEGKTLWKGSLNEAATVIRLSYRENAFSFEFSGIDPTAPHGIQYAYRMVGFGQEWQKTDAQHRSASFTNLEPGSYRFEIKAAHPYGKWSPVRGITLVITPPFWKTVWFKVGVFLLALGLLAVAMRFLLFRQEEANRNRIREAEQEILRLQNEKLEQEVAAKKERLNALLVQTAHKNEFLIKIKEDIQTVSDEKTLRRQLLSAIHLELREENYWDQFQINFGETHQEFIRSLRHLHPSLSPNDIRLSCFIRMHLSNREMASILNITLGGVEKGKFRLKQKLNLPKDTDLNTYLVDL